MSAVYLQTERGSRLVLIPSGRSWGGRDRQALKGGRYGRWQSLNPSHAQVPSLHLRFPELWPQRLQPRAVSFSQGGLGLEASLSCLHWASSFLLYRTLRLGHIFISQQRIIWILRIFLCFIEFNSPQSLSEPLFHQSATFPGRTRQRLLLEDRSCLREQAGRAGF